MFSGDEAAKSFDRIADEYERIRPGYPDALVERVIAFSGVDGRSQVLEIGAGTGKGTLPFAQRGLAILALEPGAALAATLRQVLASFPRVSVHVTSFEAFESSPGVFDLVFAAQSFHWLDPERRVRRVAELLR